MADSLFSLTQPLAPSWFATASDSFSIGELIKHASAEPLSIWKIRDLLEYMSK